MVIIISPHIVRLGTARQEQDKIEEIINFTKESDFKPQDSKNTTKDSAPQDSTKQDSSTDTDTDSTPQNKQDSTQSLEAPLESKPNKQDSALSQPLAYKTDSPIPPHKAHI